LLTESIAKCKLSRKQTLTWKVDSSYIIIYTNQSLVMGSVFYELIKKKKKNVNIGIAKTKYLPIKAI